MPAHLGHEADVHVSDTAPLVSHVVVLLLGEVGVGRDVDDAPRDPEGVRDPTPSLGDVGDAQQEVVQRDV